MNEQYIKQLQELAKTLVTPERFGQVALLREVEPDNLRQIRQKDNLPPEVA